MKHAFKMKYKCRKEILIKNNESYKLNSIIIVFNSIVQFHILLQKLANLLTTHTYTRSIRETSFVLYE
jgi:hypothetical protein